MQEKIDTILSLLHHQRWPRKEVTSLLLMLVCGIVAAIILLKITNANVA
jgi:hypothetical protein